MISTAVRASADIHIPDGQQQIRSTHPRITAQETLAILQAEDQPEIFIFATVVQETIITNLLKPGRQNMHQVPSNKFFAGDCNCALRVTWLLPTSRESDSVFGNRQNPAVRNCNLVGVSAEIFDCVAETVESFLDVRTPVLLIEGISKALPRFRIFQIAARVGEHELTVFIELVQFRKEFALEHIPKDMHRDEEISFGTVDELPVTCKSGTGNNTVHMDMVIQFLIPCMQNLNYARLCTEILLIGRQLQNRPRTASVKQAINSFLVTVHEIIEIVRQRENDVEIRCVDNFSSTFVNPDFPVYSLTIRAVAVSAGIIVNDSITAFTALRDVVTESSGLAVEYGGGGFLLFRRHWASGCLISWIGTFPYLLNFGMAHQRMPSILSSGLTVLLTALDARWT